MNLNKKKPVALISPVIGEFGFTVFDIQQRVRAFFRKYPDHHKVVIAYPSLHELFELADEMIEPNLSMDYLPCGRGADLQYHNSDFYKMIHEHSLTKYDPDVYFKIEYENMIERGSGQGYDLRYCLDGTKLKELGWETTKTLEELLEKTVNWTIKNKEWI
ncbi:hypothetical protein CMI47_22080 [Candidatus Pacearchaeota archaeon]|nr:hypothetical protein [Candidatus Pacearchaeota archaeon]|tara:strand:- start:256 stop:735 length:480 start_codon:yes stop_codon:yes gene_type:complete